MRIRVTCSSRGNWGILLNSRLFFNAFSSIIGRAKEIEIIVIKFLCVYARSMCESFEAWFRKRKRPTRLSGKDGNASLAFLLRHIEVHLIIMSCCANDFCASHKGSWHDWRSAVRNDFTRDIEPMKGNWKYIGNSPLHRAGKIHGEKKKEELIEVKEQQQSKASPIQNNSNWV